MVENGGHGTDCGQWFFDLLQQSLVKDFGVHCRLVGRVFEDIPSSEYQIVETGQGSQLNVAFGALTQALILSILLMYMLMAALYESFIYPLVMAQSPDIYTLPVALATFATGQYQADHGMLMAAGSGSGMACSRARV